MATTPPPAISTPDPTGDYSRAQSWSVIMAKYADAGNWAQWAATLMNTNITDIQNLLGKDIVGQDLADIKTALDAIELYTPPAGFTYNAPVAPTYDTVPTYSVQTLGAILDIPAVEEITVGNAPSTDLVFTNEAFTDSLADTLRGKLDSDLSTSSTGLGDAEAGMFARAIQRENDVLTEAYNGITTALSSRGFDIPPGSLSALQAQESNKSVIRLTDVNTGILEQSSKLAQAWNQTATTASVQLLELLSRVFDSKVMRDFESAKQKVAFAIEGFKQEVAVALAKADLNKVAITSTIQANQGTVEVFKAEIEGQVAPMKAVAETNQAKASSYGAQVSAESANLQAQMAPEELKLKGVVANADISSKIASITVQEATLAIEQANRVLQLEVGTLQGLASGAQQMVASALNTVTSSASFGWSGSAGTSYKGNTGDVDKQEITYKQG